MDLINNSKYKIILGSSSSRRRELLELTGINFTVQTYTINEDFPTADTLVWYKNKCWGKPKDKNEAKQMLKLFSGNSHDVITSVGFLTTKGFKILTESTEVTYKELNKDEIDYYVDTMNPTDKAGSYGIQDWIGMIGIEKIIGSYTSVLGLPVPQVVNEIISIIKNEG